MKIFFITQYVWKKHFSTIAKKRPTVPFAVVGCAVAF
jgi:hypothetical protein